MNKDRDNVKLTWRVINPRTQSKFLSELNNCNWNDVYQSSNPNIAYENFLHKYLTIYTTQVFQLKK